MTSGGQVKVCLLAFVVGGASLVLAGACGGSDSTGVTSPPPDARAGNPENTGQSCQRPADCYPALDAGSLEGEVQCLDRVTGGYCTHLCKTDADCCAVPGECKYGLKQVCSPFESTGQMMCFLSCEEEDIERALDGGVRADSGADGGELDDTTFCTTYATTGFRCRSSGGGSKNRKVCVP
jgi:hypothetical protein